MTSRVAVGGIVIRLAMPLPLITLEARRAARRPTGQSVVVVVTPS
jgi:hypothetical protein